MAPAAPAAVPVGGGDWGANAQQFRSQPGAQFDFVCPAGGSFGSVWGTGIFTDDSSVCTAAVHQAGITQAVGATARIIIWSGE